MTQQKQGVQHISCNTAVMARLSSDIEMDDYLNSTLDDDSESLLSSTAQHDAEQALTITDSRTLASSGVKLPLSHNCVSASVPADISRSKPGQPIIRPTSMATVATSQPRFNPHEHCSGGVSGAEERLFVLSMCLGILCAICGSPLTLACFVPAMFLSRKVLNVMIYFNYQSVLTILYQVSVYSESGEIVTAQMARCFVWILIIFGVLSGLVILGAVIALRPTLNHYHTDHHRHA